MMLPTSARPSGTSQRAGYHLLTTSLLALFCFTSAHYAAAASSPTVAQHTDSLDNHSPPSPAQSTDASTTHSLTPRSQQAPGSACAGSEGQWNCMTTSWQRCAAGEWSAVMQCAAGTECAPAGLTYDFTVQATDAGQGSSSDAGSSSSGQSGGWQMGWPWWILVMTVLGTVFTTAS